MKNRIWAVCVTLGLAAGAGMLHAQRAGSGTSGVGAFKNEVTIRVENGVRIITSNGIPAHETGKFPGAGNPNRISPQHYEFRVPADPKPAAKTTTLRMQPFGVAVNGVVFDPGADEWWNGDRSSGLQYEPLTMPPPGLGTDASHAHVQPNGAYHYHGIPAALVYSLTGGQQKMVIVGWAADGFPIYNNLGHANPNDSGSPLKTLKSSYAVRKGQRPGGQNGPGGAYDGTFVADFEYAAGSGDLDECNGLVGATPEYPTGIYHYVLTEQFPYIPRLFRGMPDASFNRGPLGGRGGGRGGAGRGPGGDGPPGGFHLIPPFAEPQLNLTDDQRMQLADLEREIKGKIATILTPEQMKTLEDARPPGARGGQGGRGGPGGRGGQGGPPDGRGPGGGAGPPDGRGPGGDDRSN